MGRLACRYGEISAAISGFKGAMLTRRNARANPKMRTAFRAYRASAARNGKALRLSAHDVGGGMMRIARWNWSANSARSWDFERLV